MVAPESFRALSTPSSLRGAVADEKIDFARLQR
jgi:hypothetical protein